MTSLTLMPLAIGSLPHSNPDTALDYVLDLFGDTPFWPQLANVDKREDMIIQYTQNIPGIVYDEQKDKYYFDTESDVFFEKLEEFYTDYEQITVNKDFSALSKYAITEPYSSTFAKFVSEIAIKQPKFIKGHLTGPFTWGASLCDNENRCGFFDDTLRDIITKALVLKALWQIEQFRQASPKSQIIIFVDEPAVCQYGTSAFVTVQKSQITDSLQELINVAKAEGVIVAIHCCGKADWEMMIDVGFDMLNLDAFLYAQNLSLYPQKVENFLKNGGYIAWGAIPTLDKEALQSITVEKAAEIFENAVSVLTNKGIDKKLVLRQSVLTPSCGAGSLDIVLAKKAMEMTVNLSEVLREKYLKEI